MRHLLAPEKTLIVRGPASVRLLDGQATALAAPLENRQLIVRESKQLPIETLSNATMEIVLGESGTMFEIEGSTIPMSWYSALESITEMREGKVAIIGATDVGKSTLSTFLSNGLLRRGIRCQMIDADIGQADIGPPTTVGKSVVSNYLTSLLDLSPSALVFVGHTSPAKVQTKLLDALRRLSNDEPRSVTIINTDGWVLDPEAIIYKLELIERVHPDLVLGIPAGRELEPILSRARIASVRIEAPETILARSRSDRREIRAAGYRRFLDGGRTRTYDLRGTKVRLPKGLASIRPEELPRLRNLILGLLDAGDCLLQIGVLQGLAEDSLTIYSRPVNDLRTIELGYVKLSSDGSEIGYLDT